LQATQRILGQSFDVVSTVTDGRAAVEATMTLRPDIVVLDIGMPALDGVQTALELKTLHSPARVVFLTMHNEEEYIVSGLTCGARAYVLKARMASDLITALERVLGGRMFISPTSVAKSEAPLWWTHGKCNHALQFYSDDDLLLDELGVIVAAALQAGNGACMNATEAHREGLARRLQTHGVDVSDAIRKGHYAVFDAAETLTSFMSGGELDVVRCASTFRTMATSSRGASQNEPSRIAAYGEIAAIACAHGRTDLALQLEQLWSDVSMTGSTFTICGYPIGPHRVPEQSAVFAEICGEHCVIRWPESSRS
jgi:CheY-like chemotaxis protein